MTRSAGGRRRAAKALAGLTGGVLAAAGALAAPGVGAAAPRFVRLTTLGVGTFPNFGMARTADGALHLVFQTTAPGSSAPTGLATRWITAAGAVGPQVQALSGWSTSRPGLLAPPGGQLVAVFGAHSPTAGQLGNIWSITSSDGGTTWGPPADVTGGALEDLAYGADITAQLSGTTPVLTVPQAGGVVIQQGLGPGSPTQMVTNSTDNFAGDVDSAVDATTGAVVASWQSLAGKGGDFVQAVAPSVGPAVRVPGQVRNEVVLAGRDTGPGVFAAYTPDGSHVRLWHYGGGSVPVGLLRGLTAKALGVATGSGGRIWVMWGQDGAGVAVTRSNRAVTRFEPIQHVNPGSFTLYRLAGDGRLGPLDLLVDQIPTSKKVVPPAGTFYARILPELSETVSVKTLKTKTGEVVAHKLTVRVTDAGDAVAGAKVAAAGVHAKTNAKGVAKLKLGGGVTGKVKVTVTAAGYGPLKGTAEL